MIDFRYHLVSIIAVFLALAVGLAVGSTALSGKAEEVLGAAQRGVATRNEALTKENSQLQEQLAADDQFAKASSARLLTDLLTGEKVVVVAAPGASGTVTTGVSKALQLAGATVTGTVRLSSTFTATSGQNEAELNQLAQSLAAKAGVPLSVAADSEVPGQEAAAQMLAVSVLAGSTGALDAKSSEDILTGLSQGGFVSAPSGDPPAPADMAVLVEPGGPAAAQTSSSVVVAVAQELQAAGRGAVLAGGVASIGSGSAISAENKAGNAVSTVDDADTVSGQIMVVQALRYLLTGQKPAAYGIGPGAAPSPAPTPDESLAVTTTRKSAR